MSGQHPSSELLKREMQAAFEVYHKEVEGLRMLILTLSEPPTKEDLRSVEYRKLAVELSLRAYNHAKARYADTMLGRVTKQPAQS